MGASIETYIPTSMADDIRKLGITRTATTQAMQVALRKLIADKKAYIAWAEAGCPEEPAKKVEAKPVAENLRTFVSTFTGENSTAIEEKAVEAAREAFGPNFLFTVVQDYQVNQNLHRTDNGKFAASVTVQVRSKLEKLRTPSAPDESRLIATVEQAFNASTIDEGIDQAIAKLHEAFGSDVIVVPSLGRVYPFNKVILGTIDAKVYLP